ncbi:MAG: 2-C-methyl-D-erythritol 4-phosphate cytidylyltransferase [Betaproteobacteria bacterium]|nr:2-C-methyl-D-erythritol 4-phosphate cytidylyltransferase [Betaproteobacteria bacterium]
MQAKTRFLLTRGEVLAWASASRQSALTHGSPGPKARCIWAVIPAAGSGSRAGLSKPKQYWPLETGVPMLVQTISALSVLGSRSDFAGILVVLAPDDNDWVSDGIDSILCNHPRIASSDLRLAAVKIGGANRSASVLAGLELIAQGCKEAATDMDWVLVHDAARPWVREPELIRLLESGLASAHGAILALPIADTVKQSEGGRRIAKTVPRDGLWAAQTPQMFALNELVKALHLHPEATDEASAMEHAGRSPDLVPGHRSNIKMTFEEDFVDPSKDPQARLSQAVADDFPRVGTGFDVHALVEGRRLMIGGVHIPHEKGLLGHSDADVLLHSIADAILGAAGLGDIGKHFPDTDSAYKDSDSRVLLRTVVDRVAGLGLRVWQLDATIIAQAPKMAPHIPAMIQNISEDTRCGLVNVKATTTEHLGFTGRAEGIAAQASVVLRAVAP